MRTILVLGLILGLGLVGCAKAPEGRTVDMSNTAQTNLPKLIVQKMNGSDVNDGLRTNLTNLFCTELAAQKTYEVICADEAAAIMQQSTTGALMGSCDDEDCLDSIEKTMQSDFTVSSTVGKSDNGYVLTAGIMNNAAKRVVKRGEYIVYSEDDLVEGVRKLAASLK